VAFAVEQASTKVALYATCHEYQPGLRNAVDAAGFELIGERAVFARQLALRIPARGLVAARARPMVGG